MKSFTSLIKYLISICITLNLLACSNLDSRKLGLLGDTIEEYVDKNLDESVFFKEKNTLENFMAHAREFRIRRVKGIKSKYENYKFLSDLKKMDRKTLIDADSSSNYEMDFQAIVNIEFGSKRIHSTNVNFWGLNFHYDETGVHPANYILIQGIAYFEQKESKWVLKNFEVSKAEAINSEKIPN